MYLHINLSILLLSIIEVDRQKEDAIIADVCSEPVISTVIFTKKCYREIFFLPKKTIFWRKLSIFFRNMGTFNFKCVISKLWEIFEVHYMSVAEW